MSLADRTAVVTGAAGFIGSAVARRLRRDGVRVIAVDTLGYAGHRRTIEASLDPARDHFVQADIADGRAMQELLTRFAPDAVFHLAAETHVDRSIDGPLPFVATNVLGTATLFEACRAYRDALSEDRRAAFRILHISTDEVFGVAPTGGRFGAHDPHRPNSPYAASKSASDQLARAWGRTFGLPIITTNCCNNYGPFQFPEKLIPLTIRRALAGQELRVYGAGDQERDWLYVDDHADALIRAWQVGTSGAVYLIGSREERQNLQVVEAICAALDQRTPWLAPHRRLIRHVTDRPAHDQRYAVEIAPTAVALRWTATTPFAVGLQRTIDWYLDNGAWCDVVTAGRYDGARLGLAEVA
ncbi:MAG: dTDP-glucose 4,6-dehydratase [Gemmatimonadaceae bacterium]|nr:dTDP-glucose 4,6-dehydratase [Gemmatimonadaceae bacterium]